MIQAAEAFRPVLDGARFAAPSIPVLSNYTANYHSTDPNEIRASLFFQIFHPVKWIWALNRCFADTRSPVAAILELGGGIGQGEDPSSKRPNLETTTRKALSGSKHAATYLAGINVETLRQAANICRAISRTTNQVHDLPPHGVGRSNAIDECWYHLFLPVDAGVPSQPALGLLGAVERLKIGDRIQLIAEPSERNVAGLQLHFGPTIDQPEPYLEVVVGSEMACILAYRSDEVRARLEELGQRLRHPGYAAGAAS
jgi:hypothetical protein